MKPFNFHLWCLIGEACLALSSIASGESARSKNFIVEAPTKQQAQAIADAAEGFRDSLASEWLGEQFPVWNHPCVIHAEIGDDLPASGATSFVFDKGQVFDWDMKIQGSEARVMDSVLPHEVLHTVFATSFRQPLPRWADEGACSSIEAAPETEKMQRVLVQELTSDKGIAFDKLLAMKEYPHDVLPLYAEGFSLTQFLIQRGGRHEFIEYVREGLLAGDWELASRTHYGFTDLQTMQDEWLAWVKNSLQR